MFTISKTFFRVTTTKNLSLSTILGNDTSMSWDLIFHRNPMDVEIENLQKLMSLLSHIHLTLIPNAKAWISSSSRVFSVKYFLLALSNFSNSTPFYPANFLWKSGVIKLGSWPSPD